MPVFAHFVAPILNATISPKMEYLFTKVLTEFPDMRNPECVVFVGNPKRYQVILVRSDQTNLLASNAPPLVSVAPL